MRADTKESNDIIRGSNDARTPALDDAADDGDDAAADADDDDDGSGAVANVMSNDVSAGRGQSGVLMGSARSAVWGCLRSPLSVTCMLTLKGFRVLMFEGV